MRKQHIVEFRKRRGTTLLPQEGIRIPLNPMERTLYRLFVAHPEGITSDNLLAHWKELCSIYENESCFDDKTLREGALESLCAESKTVFYSTVSRIKKKLVSALGRRKASPYIIQRDKNGLYKTRARLQDHKNCYDSPGKMSTFEKKKPLCSRPEIECPTSKW